MPSDKPRRERQLSQLILEAEALERWARATEIAGEKVPDYVQVVLPKK